jgi:hypothetical protein
VISDQAPPVLSLHTSTSTVTPRNESRSTVSAVRSTASPASGIDSLLSMIVSIAQ